MLRRNLQAAHERGFTFFVAPDIEFFYFAPPEKGQAPVPLDEGGFFDLTTTDVAGTLRKQTIRTLETMSIPVEYSFHEDAPSQHEIDLRHTDALTMADSIMTFRLVVKEVAASQGVHATFMPKPLEGVQGSGMHVHLSLFDGEDNAFYSSRRRRTTCRRSPSSSWPACCATPPRSPPSPTRRSTATSAWCRVSRRRCTSAGRATTAAAWSGCRSPSAATRSATRIEFRSPDPACNPYLAFAVHARRRHARHHRGLRAAARGRRNLFEMSDAELAKLGIDQLPQSLSDSLKVMEQSTLVHEALGEHIFEWFLRNKRSEWRAYKTHVSAFEHDRYLRSAVAMARDGATRRLPGPAAARPGPHARPRRLPVEGGRLGGGRRHARAADGLGRARSSPATPTPRVRGRSAGRCASATIRHAAAAARQRCAARRPGAARRPVRRLLPHPVPPGRGRGPAAAPPVPGRRRGRDRRSVEYSGLALNLETYQASIEGRPLDLTYMEYELLKFLAQNPGKVFTREMLLSAGCGATSTTAGRARSTSTSAACGPSSARSTPT